MFKGSLPKDTPASFILKLPAYKVPKCGHVLRTVWTNTRTFLIKAGTTIFCLSVIFWAMTYYPRLSDTGIINAQVKGRAEYAAGTGGELARFQAANPGQLMAVCGNARIMTEDQMAEQAVASEQLRHSVAGRLGHAIEPVIKPLGFDWKMGVGLVGAFAAREVFVSTLSIVYSAGEIREGVTPMAQAMTADRYTDGKLVWTPLVAGNLLVWFVLTTQCVSSLAKASQKTRGWAWAIGVLAYAHALAWIVCFFVYQLEKLAQVESKNEKTFVGSRLKTTGMSSIRLLVPVFTVCIAQPCVR